MNQKEKLIGEAIILGVQSITAFKEYETKQRQFNNFIKKHKVVK